MKKFHVLMCWMYVLYSNYSRLGLLARTATGSRYYPPTVGAQDPLMNEDPEPEHRLFKYEGEDWHLQSRAYRNLQKLYRSVMLYVLI